MFQALIRNVLTNFKSLRKNVKDKSDVIFIQSTAYIMTSLKIGISIGLE